MHMTSLINEPFTSLIRFFLEIAGYVILGTSYLRGLSGEGRRFPAVMTHAETIKFMGRK